MQLRRSRGSTGDKFVSGARSQKLSAILSSDGAPYYIPTKKGKALENMQTEDDVEDDSSVIFLH